MADITLSPSAPTWAALRARVSEACEAARVCAAAPIRFAPGGRALLTPLAFGGGAALYLCAPFEPPALIAYVVAVFGLIVWAAASRRDASGAAAAFGLLVFLCAAGAARAEYRAQALSAPIVAASDAPRRFEGWVERVDAAGEGRKRYVVRVSTLEGAARAQAPIRIRVSALDSGLRPGGGASGLAVLGPPPGPVEPGAYDFARAAWFDRLGGAGYAFGRLQTAQVDTPAGERFTRGLARVRAWLADRLVAAGGSQGGFIAALTTGDRSAVPEPTTEALRGSGLGHVLAISGLHLALVAGGAYAALGFLLASFEPLARRCDVRKPAAAAALVVASVYLVLSGASTPTVRAFVMTSVVLVAVLADRRALSLRSVAVAALVILILEPESVVEPGFQMSFAAAAALIAAHEARRGSDHLAGADRGPLAGLRRFAGDLSATSVIAGGATAVFGAFHFQTMAAYGLLANLIAMPIFTLIAMPAVALAAVLTPFGLEEPPAFVAAQALGVVEAIAAFFGDRSDALTPIAAGPGLALAFAAFGLGLACAQASGRLRTTVPLAVAAIAAWSFWPQPSAWIGPKGDFVAWMRADEGQARTVGPTTAPAKFAAVRFARRRATGPPTPADLADDAVACDRRGCVYRFAARKVLVATGPPDLDDCARAELIILARPPPARWRSRCAAEIITPNAAGPLVAYADARAPLRFKPVAADRIWTRAGGV